MLFTTFEQFIVLGGLLLGGLLLGYASAPGSKKWKRRVREQSDSFSAYYADAEDRARAANQRAADLKTEVEALRADHAEAQRTISDLRAAAVVTAPAPALVEPTPEPVAEHPVTEVAPEPEPVVAPAADPVAESAVAEPAPPIVDDGVIEPVAAPQMTPTATDAPPAPIGPAEPEMPSKGWFASSARDELTRIRGIDDVLNTRLFGLGVVRFEDLEKLSAEDEMALEQRLSLPVGYIAREQWRTQAALLRAGQNEEHATHFAPREPEPVV